MDLIPVLDVKDDIVVHGVKGDRESYEPIDEISKIIDSASLIGVAEELCDLFEFETFYVADLDSILNNNGNTREISRVKAETGKEIMVDMGVASVNELEDVPGRAIIAMETIKSREDILAAADKTEIVLSIDMKAGRLMNPLGFESPQDVMDWCKANGLERVILLDLAKVGSESGPAQSIIELARQNPELEVITGGGIRNRDDLKELEEAGINGVLVSTALHKEQLTPSDFG